MRRMLVLVGVRVLLLLVVLATPPQALASTPTEGQSYANGVAVDGPCSDTEEQVDTHIEHWLVGTVDPKRADGGPGGVELTESPLPRLEKIGEGVTDDFSAAPVPQGWAQVQDPGGPCVVTSLGIDASVSGQSVILGRPGPYVFQIYDSTVHHVLVNDGSEDPTPAPCAENDTEYYPFNLGLPPADAPAGQHWAAESFCNKTTVIHFFVRSDNGACPVSGNMTQWPSVPYINQYDAGARLGLPKNGGNACGPSSLLMGLLKAGAGSTPTLPSAYDETMAYRGSQLAPGAGNEFKYYKAATFLKSLGFRQARPVFFGASSDEANVQNVAKLYQEVVKGPVVLSTAFGTGRWGVTGGGHMILVTGIKNGNFVVSDPAGNYFGDNTSHYGAGRCGYGVTYPVDWVKAYVVNRALLRIGARSARPREGLQSRAATAQFGTAISIADTNPETADNPQTFYLQDAAGRRAGWIDGAVFEEIPDSFVGKDPPTRSDPEAGDPDIEPAPAAPTATARAIVVPEPQPGTVLHVATSGAYALTVNSWIDGAVVGRDDLAGSGSGQDVTVASHALDMLAGRPVVSRLALAPRSFRAARSGPSARGAAKRTARVTFSLSVAASVRFTVERQAAGRFRRIAGSFTRLATAGANVFRFTGRIAGRRLRPAHYRLVAKPIAHGLSGRRARVAFRIVH
jgi:hypothetical protein